MELHQLTEAINSGRILVTDHADEEAFNDHVGLSALFSSIPQGEIIEDYPKDRPYPSCLVLSFVEHREPIHSVWAYNEHTRWAVLITVYRPDPEKWVNWRERRRS